MSLYLVRWKFGPNSLLNRSSEETSWYQQIHPNKKEALDHYISLLQNHTPSADCKAEIYEMVQLVPGAPEPEEEIIDEAGRRNIRIMEMYEAGYSRREIAERVNLAYATVCAIIKKINEQ